MIRRISIPLAPAMVAAAFILIALAAGIFAFRIAQANPHPGQSVDVAVLGTTDMDHGGFLPAGGVFSSSVTGDLDFTAFNFTDVSVSDLNPATLANYDTVFLNVGGEDELRCNVDVLTDQQKADLVNFVAGGGKMIIYDSECTPAGGVDYSWLPFPFTTDNPGASGEPGLGLTIVEDNTLSHSDASDPHFIDATALNDQTDAVGDMNVMVTLDSNWCLDMSGTNLNEVTGPVHTYARFGSVGSVGLIIYNGMDMDDSDSGGAGDWLVKVWLQELQQPFNPDNLPCAVPVAGISLTPETATNNVGTGHTVTATVIDLLGEPTADVSISFEVTDGPNVGDTGSDITDANGEATFTYTGDGGTGTDTIQACFLDEQEQEHCDTATKTWVKPEPTPTATAVPTSTAVAEVVQLPRTGGTPSEGASGLPWLVLAAGLITLTSAGLILVSRTRRAR